MSEKQDAVIDFCNHIADETIENINQISELRKKILSLQLFFMCLSATCGIGFIIIAWRFSQ